MKEKMNRRESGVRPKIYSGLNLNKFHDFTPQKQD